MMLLERITFFCSAVKLCQFKGTYAVLFEIKKKKNSAIIKKRFLVHFRQTFLLFHPFKKEMQQSIRAWKKKST